MSWSVLDGKRVFSGYGDPTAAWHGTSSPI